MSADKIRDGIEASTVDGWSVSHYVTIAAVERISSDGTVEVGLVLFTAADQASYITEGLLMAADRLTCTADEDCD